MILTPHQATVFESIGPDLFSILWRLKHLLKFIVVQRHAQGESRTEAGVE